MFKNKFFKIVIIILSIILIIGTFLLLSLWTSSIKKQKENEKIINSIKNIVNEQGEASLLSLAGVTVKDILYGDDGIYIIGSDNNSDSYLYTIEEKTAMNVYEKCNKAVVHISSASDLSSSSISKINDRSGNGSGFFVSPQGYITTDYHVIENAANIYVTTWDKKQYIAQTVGFDKELDIAVLKINSDTKEGFPYLTFASKDSLKVGQRVYALGNPFGYDRTLSSGIISGLSRAVRNSEGTIMLGMIQTDVSVFPGSSGCPLLNSKGQVIGICSSIYSESGTNQSMSFAISADVVNNCIINLIRYGKIEKTWLDLVPVQLSSQIVEYASLKVDKGLLVSQVIAGGKAASAGIKGGTKKVQYGNSIIYLGGDIITKVNGMEIFDYSDLFNSLIGTKVGDKVNVTVNRNGVSVELKVELTERTDELLNLINR